MNIFEDDEDLINHHSVNQIPTAVRISSKPDHFNSDGSSQHGSDESEDDNWSISSLTADVTGSFVDTKQLLSTLIVDTNHHPKQKAHPIGMTNFKSKKVDLEKQKVKSLIVQQHTLLPKRTHRQNLARMRWHKAAHLARALNDPWHDFKVDSYEVETAIRHRYNAIKKVWIQDECKVKIEPNSFAKGAMRACYRMKKLSHISTFKNSWEHASNYVAKSYMDKSIPRERYWAEAKLQMDAKLWAEMYNRHNPPKKIDMFQVSILEFVNRPDSPLFHLEHYLDGTYVKYNSNSGFVDDEHVRFTPQAFSHFTFESSNHELMVVDIQGVGDLYTDPQIHTANGQDYGDGNLGVKGFALFFYSHKCNDVCRSLGLSEFDLAPSELKSHQKIVSNMQNSFGTVCKKDHDVQHVAGSPSSFGEYFRMRNRNRSQHSSNSEHDLIEIDESEGYESSSSPLPKSPNSKHQNNGVVNPFEALTARVRRESSSNRSQSSEMSETHESSIPIPSRPNAPATAAINLVRRSRIRNDSNCLDSAFSEHEAANYFQNIEKIKKPRASCVYAERDFILKAKSNVAANYKSKYPFLDDDDDEDDDDEDIENYATRHNLDYGNDDDDDDADDSYNHAQDNNIDKYKEMDDNNNETFKANDSDENNLFLKEESILGKVHLELCKCHEMGRFNLHDDDLIDEEAAFFHLKEAAGLGIVEALLNLAKIYLDLPHDILATYKVQESDENIKLAFNCFIEAAKQNDKYSIFHLAKSYDTGENLDNKRSIDWKKATGYYKKLLNLLHEPKTTNGEANEENDEENNMHHDLGYSEINDIDPEYLLLARLGEIYKQGGHGIESNASMAVDYFTEAAEKAMEMGKGRLANKYYMLAEEANAELD